MPLMEIGTLTDVTNLVKNINNLLSENRLEYCRRVINRYADALIKMAHM